jgi:hypothetical protein
MAVDLVEAQVSLEEDVPEEKAYGQLPLCLNKESSQDSYFAYNVTLAN